VKSRVMNTDDIAVMPDDELNRRISSLTGFIERERRRGTRHVDLEVEHSYLAREAEIRMKRKENHERWVRGGGRTSLEEEMYS